MSSLADTQVGAVARIQPYLFLVGLVVYGFTAWFSEGYHHPDEHFQILEFANFKLGRSPVTDLPWEFAAQIRPGLQPMLVYGFIRVAEALGLDNPFTQVFLLRLLTGWLCLWVYFQWAGWVSTISGDARLGWWLRIAVVFLWFVPYLSVRVSSENWAGLVFMIGLLGLLRGGVGTFIAAFCLALSFFFRFQMGFVLLGLGVWMGWQWQQNTSSRPTLAQVGQMLAGGLVAVALGIWADAWLYSKPVYPAYHYFAANILENKAAQWGTSPWWFYFAQSLLTIVPPVSLVLMALLGLGAWRERRGALVWCFIPFLLAHIAVGHKEMRFLYPMLLPVLILVVQGLGHWNLGAIGGGVRQSRPNRLQVLFRAICWMAVVVNFLLLPVRCLLAAQESVPHWRFLYGYAAAESEPVVVFSQEKSVYNVVGLEVHFYKSPKVQPLVVQRFDLDTLGLALRPRHLLFSPKLKLQNPPAGLPTECIYTYFPEWVLRFNPNDWQRRSRIWSLHRCLVVRQ